MFLFCVLPCVLWTPSESLRRLKESVESFEFHISEVDRTLDPGGAVAEAEQGIAARMGLDVPASQLLAVLPENRISLGRIDFEFVVVKLRHIGDIDALASVKRDDLVVGQKVKLRPIDLALVERGGRNAEKSGRGRLWRAGHPRSAADQQMASEFGSVE